jgi:hypothetical protein
MRKIEITPQYTIDNHGAPWTTIDQQHHDFKLCASARGSNNQRFRKKTNWIFKENAKIYTVGPKEEREVGYAVVWEEQMIKRKINNKNSINNAEQSVIINAIYSTWKKQGRK